MKKYFLNKSFVCGVVMAGLVFALTFAGFFFMPYDPNQIDVQKSFLPFSASHILGTDHLGRDVLSRLMFASRISIFTGSSATIFGLFFGTFLGGVCGYFGGALDLIFAKIIDILLSFPGILLALVFACVFGGKISVTIFALSVMSVPRFFRIVRSGFIKFRNSTFVLASKARGACDFRIMTRHILPNILSDIFVTASLNFSLCVLSESALSYLGLSAPPPLASFGRMMSDCQRFIFTNASAIIFPCVALLFLSLGFNLIGEGISQVKSGE